MERTKLSAVVKALRKEYGLTQEDLAMKSGVGLCFIRSLEQGKTTLRMVQAIAEAVVPQPPSPNHLRLRILAVDGRHVRMPLLRREGIAHYLCRCCKNQETPDMLPKVHIFTHIPQLITHFSSPALSFRVKLLFEHSDEVLLPHGPVEARSCHGIKGFCVGIVILLGGFHVPPMCFCPQISTIFSETFLSSV